MYNAIALLIACLAAQNSPSGLSDRSPISISAPPGTSVLVDGRAVADVDRTGTVRVALAPGVHTIEVRRGSLAVDSVTVELSPNSRTVLHFDLRGRRRQHERH